jgi:5-methylcytosine-specific restriction endonuclease McrA
MVCEHPRNFARQFGVGDEMPDIPQDLVDRMMVKCGRRCCICRRFLPTKLQVHHIIERANGGTNEEDN